VGIPQREQAEEPCSQIGWRAQEIDLFFGVEHTETDGYGSILLKMKNKICFILVPLL
jgi:hypothetical protein